MNRGLPRGVGRSSPLGTSEFTTAASSGNTDVTAGNQSLFISSSRSGQGLYLVHFVGNGTALSAGTSAGFLHLYLDGELVVSGRAHNEGTATARMFPSGFWAGYLDGSSHTFQVYATNDAGSGATMRWAFGYLNITRAAI